MLMRGRQIRLASIQPVGSAPLQTKPALSLSGASATQATVGTYYDFSFDVSGGVDPQGFSRGSSISSVPIRRGIR